MFCVYVRSCVRLFVHVSVRGQIINIIQRKWHNGHISLSLDERPVVVVVIFISFSFLTLNKIENTNEMNEHV